MKVYIIEPGVKGALYLPWKDNGRKNPPLDWEVREKLDFADFEMIFDPIGYLNNKKHILENPWYADQARKGLAGFMRKGNKSFKPYILVVPYDQVKVLC